MADKDLLVTETSPKIQKNINGRASNIGTIKSLPEEERPRERLLLNGAASLSTSELLAIVIGAGAPGISAITLSQKIISTFGKITDLYRLDVGELLSINGIGVAKACQMLATFELARRFSGAPIIKSKTYSSSECVYNLVKPFLLHKHREHFITVALDSRRRLIAIDNISIGTVNQTLVHPREVFKAAINRRASYLILAHNHPSGDTNPSVDDLAITERLLNVSKTIGIPILDHLIVSDSGYMSFKKEAYIS
ncbi:hypothetical protein CO178_01505 [candidate division WWE3 bacterium CG_4_9_14_3_um_filter_34_6]|uniref:MPN domain-containing protein n=1 Tax=candidate division WWE3 bacterium CG_4_9_14_3_um_filter_34_6 TaxID=1975079 RepID=A0A2M7X498_UNCKA|nr:MAG: hypothetical protein CO178_01505 [candidate division WWE3 bacterium CG_4_9_14_3_um_filter_34_6]